MSWMKIVSIIIIMLEMQMFFLVAESIWRLQKNQNKINKGLILILSVLGPVLISFLNGTWVYGYIYFVIYILLFFFNYKLPFRNKIFICLTVIILLNILEHCVRMVYELVLRLFELNTNRKIDELIVYCVLFVILIVVRMYIQQKNLFLFDYNDTVSNIIFVLVGCMIFYVCCIILSELFLSYDSLAKPAVIIFGALGYSGVLVGFILLYRLLVSRKIYRQSSEFNRQQLLMKEEYYKKILKSQHEIKKIRHDIKNNLNTMNQLLSADKDDEARRFLGEMLQEFNEIPKIYSVGNEIVDLIVNDKYSKAVESGIKCSTEGMLPEIPRMTTLDFCTIFSNLLDNAIEANENVEADRFISLSIRTYNEEVMIMLENSCTLADFAPTDKLKTTKKDSGNHGYGTENIRSSIEKYGGRISYECQNNVFAAKIVINKN